MRVAQAREAFLAACRAGADCGESYRQAVARLEQNAPFVPLPQDLRVPGNRVRLTPSLFEEVVGRLVYYPPTHAELPYLITATRDSDLLPVGSALAALLQGAERNGNEGAFVAVECRDRPRWREPAAPDASPLDLGLLPPGVCASWSAPGPEPEVPHDTAVPTLVLAGQFDPNITLEQSLRVADRIGPKARWILFAGTGHSVRHFSTCAQTLVAAFIAQPDQRQDTACAAVGETFGPAQP